MITVHHLNDSRSQRVLWLLEELGLPYEIKRYERMTMRQPARLAPPELKAVHPLGKSPVITDDGRTVHESGAILEYILRHYGAGRLQPPADSPLYDDYLQWLHYAEGSAMFANAMFHYVSRMDQVDPHLTPRVTQELENNLGFIDNSLAGQKWIVGSAFSAADIQMAFVAEFADFIQQLGSYGHIRTWLDHCQARPAYLAALKRGGPYGFGPKVGRAA